MADNKQNNNCSDRPNSTDFKDLYWMVVIVLIISVVVPVAIFFYHILTNEAINSHELTFDEEMIATIKSLDSNCIAMDSIQLRQEVGNVKELTQYLINRESNYQMEIDQIIDKYSQWTGYWLSIIGIVLTLFTIIQVLLNYRMNNQYEKMVKEAIDECKTTAKEVKEKYDSTTKEVKEKYNSTTKEVKEKYDSTTKEIKEDNQKEINRINNQYEKMVKEAIDECKTTTKEIKEDSQKEIKKIENTYHENFKKYELSILHNNLSCINACLSTFPDAFSFSPTEERIKFVKTFMSMLSVEYTKFTEYINKLYLSKITKGVYKEETDMPYLSAEMKYVYLVWCDISIAINKASLDYTEAKQTVAFENLKESLSTVIINYHDGKITAFDIVNHMRLIQKNIEEVTHLI